MSRRSFHVFWSDVYRATLDVWWYKWLSRWERWNLYSCKMCRYVILNINNNQWYLNVLIVYKCDINCIKTRSIYNGLLHGWFVFVSVSGWDHGVLNKIWTLSVGVSLWHIFISIFLSMRFYIECFPPTIHVNSCTKIKCSICTFLIIKEDKAMKDVTLK